MSAEPQPKVTHKYSAAITGQFAGNVSHFNQFIIIGAVALIILISIFSGFSLKDHGFLVMVYLFTGLLVVLLYAGFIRNSKVKPSDDIYSITTKIATLDKSIEICNAPVSLLTNELFAQITCLRFFQNDAPAGIIQGEVTNKGSIKILTNEEREAFKQKETKEIVEHQHKIIQNIRHLSTSPNVSAPIPSPDLTEKDNRNL